MDLTKNYHTGKPGEMKVKGLRYYLTCKLTSYLVSFMNADRRHTDFWVSDNNLLQQ